MLLRLFLQPLLGCNELIGERWNMMMLARCTLRYQVFLFDVIIVRTYYIRVTWNVLLLSHVQFDFLKVKRWDFWIGRQRMLTTTKGSIKSFLETRVSFLQLFNVMPYFPVHCLVHSSNRASITRLSMFLSRPIFINILVKCGTSWTWLIQPQKTINLHTIRRFPMTNNWLRSL